MRNVNTPNSFSKNELTGFRCDNRDPIEFHRTLEHPVIYTMVGEYDTAVDEIEYVLSIPGWSSVHDLRLDPIWDPLRDHLATMVAARLS